MSQTIIAAVALAGEHPDRPIAIQNAKVLTGVGGDLERGTILINDGKIAQIGADIPIPSNSSVVDAAGHWVTPGFIDVHTHISVKAEPLWMPSISDVTEITSPITPTARALDALNPADWAIPKVRRAGFTTVCALPGSGNLIGGHGVVFKTRTGTTVYDLLVDHPPLIKFALGENPKRIHGGQQNKTPMTRLANAAILRETLQRALNLSDRLAAGSADVRDPGIDLQLLPLVGAVRGETTCRIHSHRADDIVTAIRIAEEFGLRYVIDHATESWKIRDFLESKDAMCIVGPLDMQADKQEVWDARLETAALLEEAGVDFCLTQDARSATRFLPAFAGIAIAHGLSFGAALTALTVNPARVLGLTDRVGSLEVGKDADLAIFDGNPFSSLTRCVSTLINGKSFD